MYVVQLVTFVIYLHVNISPRVECSDRCNICGSVMRYEHMFTLALVILYVLIEDDWRVEEVGF